MKTIYLLLAAFLPLTALAQCFSAGTGTDGAYHATANTTLAGGTYNYTSFTIDPGVTVSVTGTQPLVVYCSGAVDIAGTLTASGANGGEGITYTSGGLGAIGVAGGGNGGNGTFASGSGPLNGFSGTNTGGGTYGSGWSGGGGAGYAAAGANASASNGIGGPAYGDADLTGFPAGSGGGGGSGGYDCGAGGGGAGGGVIVFYAGSFDLAITGSISSNGGNGGSDGTGNCGGGGGGSGGTIYIASPYFHNDGLIRASGGTGGASAIPGNPYYGTGGNGADGRIRLDYGTMTGSGSVIPAVGSNYELLGGTVQAVTATCSGEHTGTATIDPTGDGPFTYLWENGEATNPATQLPEGDNDVTITDANGCFAVITVNVPVTGPFASAQSFTICSGESVTVGSSTYSAAGTYDDIFTSVSGCDSIVTTTVTVNGPYSSSQSFDICSGESVTVGMSTYTTTGVYQDVFTSVTGCDSTVTTTVTVASPVNVAVTNNDISLTAQATGSTFQWIDCDNGNAQVSGATSATFSPASNGEYAVIVTTNGCSDTSACEAITDLGFGEQAQDLVSVYPNPTSGNVTLDFGKETAVEQLKVTDLSGRIVYAQQALTAKTLNIDLSGESKGVYLLHVRVGNAQQMLKITKQ